MFYRFVSNPKINWRKSVYRLTLQLWSRIRFHSGRKEGTACLIVDDTDYPKTGRCIVNIGRVFSHVQHRCILGFKALFLTVTDGTTQMILDFALLGEKGRDGKFGMSDEEIARRFI